MSNPLNIPKTDYDLGDTCDMKIDLKSHEIFGGKFPLPKNIIQLKGMAKLKTPSPGLGRGQISDSGLEVVVQNCALLQDNSGDVGYCAWSSDLREDVGKVE